MSIYLSGILRLTQSNEETLGILSFDLDLLAVRIDAIELLGICGLNKKSRISLRNLIDSESDLIELNRLIFDPSLKPLSCKINTM